MLVVEVSENLWVCMTLAVLKILTDCNKMNSYIIGVQNCRY